MFTALKRLVGICPLVDWPSALLLPAEVLGSFDLSSGVVFSSSFAVGVAVDVCATLSAFLAATAAPSLSGDSGRGNSCKPESGTPSC